MLDVVVEGVEASSPNNNHDPYAETIDTLHLGPLKLQGILVSFPFLLSSFRQFSFSFQGMRMVAPCPFRANAALFLGNLFNSCRRKLAPCRGH